MTEHLHPPKSTSTNIPKPRIAPEKRASKPRKLSAVHRRRRPDSATNPARGAKTAKQARPYSLARGKFGLPSSRVYTAAFADVRPGARRRPRMHHALTERLSGGTCSARGRVHNAPAEPETRYARARASEGLAGDKANGRDLIKGSCLRTRKVDGTARCRIVIGAPMPPPRDLRARGIFRKPRCARSLGLGIIRRRGE